MHTHTRGLSSIIRCLSLFHRRVSRRPIVKPRAYAFHSMADADWGWKKRSDPAVVPFEVEDEEGELEPVVDKRHIGSLGSNGPNAKFHFARDAGSKVLCFFK